MLHLTMANQLNEREFIPVKPFIEKGQTQLIVGTFTPHKKFWNFNFFYPDYKNRLWNVLGKVAFGDNYQLDYTLDSLKAVEERKNILRKLNAGMVNIIESCTRKNNSSLDNNLQDITLYNIIEVIVKPHSTITYIYLTGFSGKNSALSLFCKLLTHQNITLHKIKHANNHSKIENPLYGLIKINNRTIYIYALYSPSPTALKAGITEELLVKQYQIIKQNGNA